MENGEMDGYGLRRKIALHARMYVHMYCIACVYIRMHCMHMRVRRIVQVGVRACSG